MRKALLIAATSALLLVAGVAVAFMSNPDGLFDGGEVELAKEEADFEGPPRTEEELKPPQEAEHPAEEKTGNEVDKSGAEDDEFRAEEEKTGDEVDRSGDEDDEPEEGEPHNDDETDLSDLDLVILHPENGEHFAEKTLVFEGEVTPGAQVFAGDYEADVDDEGRWRIVLILNEGGNLATFTAVDAAGNETTAQVKVYYDPAPGESDKDNDEEHEFTANQKYGSCAEDPPYDVWYGTGEPGIRVWIESEYGAASTTVGDDGDWEVKVVFSEAPCGETFKVVLETDAGVRKVYEFVRICEDKEEDGK